MQELDKENLVAEVVVVVAVAAVTVVAALHIIQDLVLEVAAMVVEVMVATEAVLVQVIAAAVALVRNKIQDSVTSQEEAKANLRNVGKLNIQ